MNLELIECKNFTLLASFLFLNHNSYVLTENQDQMLQF